MTTTAKPITVAGIQYDDALVFGLQTTPDDWERLAHDKASFYAPPRAKYYRFRALGPDTDRPTGMAVVEYFASETPNAHPVRQDRRRR